MQIVVKSGNMVFDDQTRAYAEYRVFAALAHCVRAIQRVTVALTEHRSVDGGVSTVCAVAVDLTTADQIGRAHV